MKKPKHVAHLIIFDKIIFVLHCKIIYILCVCVCVCVCVRERERDMCPEFLKSTSLFGHLSE